jgi:hypothetical protein
MNKHKPKKISKFTHVKLGSNKEEHSFEDENQNKEPYQDQESLNSDDGKQETNSQKKSTDFGFLNGFSLSGKKNNSKAFDKDDEDLFFDESDRQNESEDDFNQSRRKYLPFSANNKEGQVNSLGLVFNQDFSENAGLQRVFKKSMIFLSLNLLSFLLLAVFGIIFFQVNILQLQIFSLSY